MEITHELADHFYTILVKAVGATDDEWLRWAFCRSVSYLGVTEYSVNARISSSVWFCIKDGKPFVRIDPNEPESKQARIVRVNNVLCQEMAKAEPEPLLDAVQALITQVMSNRIESSSTLAAHLAGVTPVEPTSVFSPLAGIVPVDNFEQVAALSD